MEDIQQILNKAVQQMVSVSTGVLQWEVAHDNNQIPDELHETNLPEHGEVNEEGGEGTHEEEIKEETKEQEKKRTGEKAEDRTCYKIVMENKEIVKLISVLSTIVASSQKVRCTFLIQNYELEVIFGFWMKSMVTHFSVSEMQN